MRAQPISRRTFVSLIALAGCRARRGARCAYCGMAIPHDSHWAAGAIDAASHALAFDTPGCLFRYRLGPHAGVHGEWVTEYYGAAGRHTDARAVRYAIGSDVVGPMGPDLVPIDPARAETFARDHHARTMLSFDAVTPETLQAL